MNQKNNNLKFTGERLIPKLNQNTAFYYEHINRYLFASQFSKNKIVLDCACGTGYGSYLMAKHGKAKQIYSIDISLETISYAQQNYPHKNIIFSVDDASTLSSLKSKSIDLITSFETIEHLSQPQSVLKQFKRVIADNGTLIISTPNKDNYHEDNKFHLHELNLEQFSKILHKYFKNVQILEQKYYLSQEISPTNHNKNINFNNQNFSTSNSNKFSVLDNRKTKPEYYIAICSNSKLPEIFSQQISLNSVDSLDASMGIIPIEKKTQVLENRLSEITSSKFYKLWPIYEKFKNFFKK